MQTTESWTFLLMTYYRTERTFTMMTIANLDRRKKNNLSSNIVCCFLSRVLERRQKREEEKKTMIVFFFLLDTNIPMLSGSILNIVENTNGYSGRWW